MAKNEIHIGNLICERLKANGQSKRWLADKACQEYSSFCKTLKQQYIDTELVLRISFILQYDFFSHLSVYFSENKGDTA